ncbi:hypothetical protein, partial [Mesorhizobium sp. B1-1-5]|uniref:hypothetical protein n=1 Tax=Mesorhizobium sp. B1-1-5 TaxID=2589979 RepID=UPI0015E3CFFA
SEIIDAKIAAAEARTDTKFAEVMGELRAIDKSTSGLKTTVVGTGIAALAIVIAILAWGSQVFSVGMDAQSIASIAVDAVAPKFDAMQAQYTDLNGKVDTVIQYLQAQQKGDRSRTLPNQQLAPVPMPNIPPKQ